MAASSSQIHHNERILQNRPEILRFTLGSEEAKFQSLVHKNILETYHLQPTRMHNMKQWLELIVPIQWRRVFAIDRLPYRELSLEFFSTFSFTDNPNLNYPSIIFRLGGVMRAVSLTEFAIRLGIYTAEEIEQGDLGTWHLVSDQQLFKFWKRLVSGKNFRVMYIKDARHRILYQIISAALFGYREIAGDLNHTDIRILHSFLTNQYLCPARYIAKACEDRFPGELNNPTICGGKIVTKLAESYGLLTSNFTSTLEPIGRVFIVDIRTVKWLHEINEPNNKSWTLVHDASPNDTPTQEIHPEAMHIETTGSVLVQPVPVIDLESWPFNTGTTSHQGASSSVPEISSFQDLPEFPDILTFQSLLELPETPSLEGLPEFSDLLLPEVPSQLFLEEIVQNISPPQTIFPGESSSHQGVPTYPQDIPPTPIVQAPPTFEDLVREVQEIKKNLADFTAEIKKDLADLTAWLKNRLP